MPNGELTSHLNVPALRILLADDFEQWRVEIRRIVESRSEWEIVSEACNGQEALEQAQNLRPDVLLLDIGMPVMNGLEAGRRIRQSCPGSLIIFVTQNSDNGVMEAALEIAAGYVLKENVARELVPTVVSCCTAMRRIARI